MSIPHSLFRYVLCVLFVPQLCWLYMEDYYLHHTAMKNMGIMDSIEIFSCTLYIMFSHIITWLLDYYCENNVFNNHYSVDLYCVTELSDHLLFNHLSTVSLNQPHVYASFQGSLKHKAPTSVTKLGIHDGFHVEQDILPYRSHGLPHKFTTFLVLCCFNLLVFVVVSESHICQKISSGVKSRNIHDNRRKYSQTCPCSRLYSAVTCIKRSHFSWAVIEHFI